MRSIYFLFTIISSLLIIPITAQLKSTEPNFELTNALSNIPIYYSIGNSEDPCNRAKNYPLIKLEPGKSTYATLTSQKPELIISYSRPEAIPFPAVLLSQFPSNKTMFVQTQLAGDRVTLVPQTGKYLGFGLSKTGRDLKNNVQKKDITINYVGHKPVTHYTRPSDCVTKA